MFQFLFIFGLFYSQTYKNFVSIIFKYRYTSWKMQNVDDIAYNRIHLGTPNVFVNGKLVISSELFSVDATILRGISAYILDEVEQLYKLLMNKEIILMI